MMRLLYNTALHLLGVVYFLASLFHPKARIFVQGRKHLFTQLQDAFATKGNPVVWIHCASLGEFEQGRPVIEQIKKTNPAIRILLTFFSPSGYEAQKKYKLADHVFYLPLDTPGAAKRFVSITHPVLAIFVKYEFWNNYTEELQKNRIPIISISSIFRPDQIFFRPWGGFFRKILKRFDHFFVQNSESVALLKGAGIDAVTLSGDTRFDRVYEITQQADEIAVAKRFKSENKVVVVGSCWPEDMEVLAPFINENQHSLRFIIAPHEITEDFMVSIERSVQRPVVRFSKAELDTGDPQVLLIDNVGMLSRLYRYGEFAWIGGGFKKGIHNILEAACYGVPVFFGNRNFAKFKEANDLIFRGGAFEIGSFPDLKKKYEMLLSQPENYILACEVTRNYVRENLGATGRIMQYCKPLLNK